MTIQFRDLREETKFFEELHQLILKYNLQPSTDVEEAYGDQVYSELSYSKDDPVFLDSIAVSMSFRNTSNWTWVGLLMPSSQNPITTRGLLESSLDQF